MAGRFFGSESIVYGCALNVDAIDYFKLYDVAKGDSEIWNRIMDMVPPDEVLDVPLFTSCCAEFVGDSGYGVAALLCDLMHADDIGVFGGDYCVAIDHGLSTDTVIIGLAAAHMFPWDLRKNEHTYWGYLWKEDVRDVVLNILTKVISFPIEFDVYHLSFVDYI